MECINTFTWLHEIWCGNLIICATQTVGHNEKSIFFLLLLFVCVSGPMAFKYVQPTSMIIDNIVIIFSYHLLPKSLDRPHFPIIFRWPIPREAIRTYNVCHHYIYFASKFITTLITDRTAFRDINLSIMKRQRPSGWSLKIRQAEIDSIKCWPPSLSYVINEGYRICVQRKNEFVFTFFTTSHRGWLCFAILCFVLFRLSFSIRWRKKIS